MKILYAPYNIASMPAITVDALNKIPGIEARGVSIVNPSSQNFGTNPEKYWKRFNVYGTFKNPVSFLWNCILAEFYLFKRILWADAIIWQWDTRVYLPHFWFLKFCGKTLLIEWLGSDIRIPEFVMQHNPYYKKAIEDKTYTYLNESTSRSQRIQKKFKFLKAIPCLCPEMTLFLNRKLFPDYYGNMQRVNIKKFEVAYPDPLAKKVCIVHTPSGTGAKGTQHVRAVVEKLKNKFEIDYIEIHNKPHTEAIKAILRADIFLDQFIMGSYGMATCEGLAMGKPVFCYLMEPVVKLLPVSCPIVNANPDTLEDTLIRFLSDGHLRYNTGIKSRKFAEEYHDVDTLSMDLVNLCKSLLAGDNSVKKNIFDQNN